MNLRSPITIEQFSETQSGLDLVRTYSVFAHRTADVEELTGRELERAKVYYAESDFLIKLRYVTGLAPEMRIILRDGRRLEIQAVVAKDQMKMEQWVYASELKGEPKTNFESGHGNLVAGS